ncbi:MAG TPA: ribokinase [Alphaproteobacteria bacterium]|nr:ribokinase [Alphaproteobacteria bacterium]
MGKVTILGIFVADLAFRAPRPPQMGETIIGSDFKMGPGGKGSNQAVAAARAGADVTFVSRLGRDAFGQIALATWKAENIRTDKVTLTGDLPTGAAYIFVQEQTGENCIIVVPGAAGAIGTADVDQAAAEIRAARVFVTQLEQPIPAAMHGLDIARKAGVTRVFNPAPAAPLPDAIYPFCDYITPNETEASALTGIEVTGLDSARAAADRLLQRGVGTALITLGEAGALYHTAGQSVLVPAFAAGKVVETTGAGDAFNGGFAAALAAGRAPLDAVRFGCATAGISVTRPGTAPSMPKLAEIEALLAR